MKIFKIENTKSKLPTKSLSSSIGNLRELEDEEASAYCQNTSFENFKNKNSLNNEFALTNPNSQITENNFGSLFSKNNTNNNYFISDEEYNKLEIPSVMSKKRRKKILWNIKDEEILFKIGKQSMKKKWNIISKILKDKTPSQCYYHFNSRNPKIKRKNWSSEEDQKISQLFQVYGRKWEEIARRISNRTGKQVRDRFLNRLDNSINRSKFSENEDLLIYNLYCKYGARWSKISNIMETRSSDMIKSRFYSSIKKRFFENQNLQSQLNMEQTSTNLNNSIILSDKPSCENQIENKEGNKLSDENLKNTSSNLNIHYTSNYYNNNNICNIHEKNLQRVDFGICPKEKPDCTTYPSLSLCHSQEYPTRETENKSSSTKSLQQISFEILNKLGEGFFSMMQNIPVNSVNTITYNNMVIIYF